MATLEMAVEPEEPMQEADEDHIEEMRRKVAEMENQLEATKREQGGTPADTPTQEAPAAGAAPSETGETGSAAGGSTPANPEVLKSIHIGQVDYSTTPLELHDHFKDCGEIVRVTILCDKWTGHPKGYAYVEFKEVAAADKALDLNETSFKGRTLKVTRKRDNVPGKGGKGGKKRAKGTWSSSGWYSPYGSGKGKGKGKGKKGKSWWG